MSGSNSGNLPSARASDEQDHITFLAIFIDIINGLLELMLKLLPLIYPNLANVDADAIIILVSTVASFVYITASKVIIRDPNMSYLQIIEAICYISGVLACGLFLSIIFRPFGWFLLCSNCAFLLIKVLIHYLRRIFNQPNQATVTEASSSNSMAQEDNDDAPSPSAV